MKGKKIESAQKLKKTSPINPIFSPLKPFIVDDESATLHPFLAMKANKQIESTLATFRTRINAGDWNESTVNHWQNRATIHLRSMNAGNAVALMSCEYVAQLVIYRLQGARGTKQSNGGNPDAGGIAIPSNATPQEKRAAILARLKPFKSGNRAAIVLSDTDKDEIHGTVANVLASRDAFSRNLEREDVAECFRAVEGVNCLELNRTWKKSSSDPQSIIELSQPIYNSPHDEKARANRLKGELQRMETVLQAAFNADKSKKRAAILATHQKTLADMISGKTRNGTQDKRARRIARAKFRDYVKAGARALQSSSVIPSKWHADLIFALDSLEVTH